MTEIGSASVAIVPTFSGFRSQVSGKAEGAGKESGGRFSGAFKAIAGPAMALVASGVFAGFVAEAARASDATDKFKSTMNFAGIDASGIDAATKAAKEYADQTVFDLPTIQATMAQLASNGVTNYVDLTKAAGNLNAVAGGNAETFKSVSRTLTQSAGAGKLMTEDWNMLADAIPGASGPLQKAMKEAGAFEGNFKKAMENGEISSEEFQAALTKLGNDPIAVEAAKSVTTFEGAIGNLQATINSGLMGALDAMKPAITGVINTLSGGLGTAFTVVGQAATGLYDLFAKGDFTAALAQAFNVSEDSGFVSFLFGIRDTAIEVGGGFRAMFAAFKAGDGDVTSSGFAGFMEQVGNAARQLFDVIGPSISAILPQIMSLWSSLSPLQIIFSAIQPLLPQLMGMFGQLASVIGGTLGTVLTSLLPTIMQLSALISQSLGSVLVAVLPAAVQMITMLGSTISQLLPILLPIITTIIQLAATLIGQLAPIITNLVSSILPPLVNIFGNILGAIGPLVTMIAGILIPVIMALMPVVVTIFGVIANVITSAMQRIQGIIQVVTGIISGNWAQVWEGIGNIFGGIWNTIVAVVSGALQIIGSVVMSGLGLVFGFVGDILGNIGRFFSDTWSNILRGVGGFIDGFLGFFRDLPGKIMGFVSGAGTWLLSVGKNIIDGLINGITSMAGTVARAILNLVPEAIRGPIEAALGIHSPSRVAMWWMEMIGAGFVKQAPAEERRIAAVMGSLIPAPNLPSLVGAGAGVRGVGQVNNFTINQVDDPIGTAHAVARRQRAVSV